MTQILTAVVKRATRRKKWCRSTIAPFQHRLIVIPCPLQLGLRHIILTENREVDLAKALEFVTSEESGSLGQFIATNATAVINTLEAEVENAMDKTTVQAQFDALVTLTYAITIYDHWLYSVTSSNKTKKLNAALLKLANYWACILEHDTPNLGIDEIDKYTLPGTLALLKKLEDKCRGGSDCAFSVNAK